MRRRRRLPLMFSHQLDRSETVHPRFCCFLYVISRPPLLTPCPHITATAHPHTMGKKKRNRNGQTVKIIRVKKNTGGYEPPPRSHSTSSEEPQSGNLFDGYGAVDLSEKETAKPVLQKPDAAHDNVSKKQLPITRPKGLTNLGNTCYFNSVLQVLSQTGLLRELLAQISPDGCEWEGIHVKNLHPAIQMEKNGTEEQNATGKEGDDEDNNSSSSSSCEAANLTVSLPPAFEIFNCFHDSLREIRTGSGAVFTPNRLLNSLSRKSCQFRGREQQDSHELLRTLLDLIRTDEIRRKRKAVLNRLGISDVKNVDDDTKAVVKSYAASCNFTTIDALFGGYLLSTVRCEECDSTSQIFEQFYDLSLPISEGHPQHNQPLGNKSHGNNQNRRGWEKKVTSATTSNTAIALPAAAAAKQSTTKAEHEDKKSIAVPSRGTNFKVAVTAGYSGGVKNRKQLRAEKKAAMRAEKQERQKQQQSVKDEKEETAGDGFSLIPESKDDDEVPDRLTAEAGGEEKSEQQQQQHQPQPSHLPNHLDTDEDDFDIGEMVPLFSDLGVTDRQEEGEKGKADSEAQDDVARNPSQVCDKSNLRIDMSYSMNASHKNLDVRLQIETSNECNVNLAINHKTSSGNKSASFECSLNAAAAAADRQPQLEQRHENKDDDQSLDPVSEVASEEDKEDRISSLSGGRGDAEDEGADEDSDAGSSTKAMIDDQDLDDQLNLLSVDESLDYWGENMIEEFTVRGDREPFEDLEPPDVIDDPFDQNHLLQLPELEHPADPIPADSAASAAAVDPAPASAIIPQEGAGNIAKPLTESSASPTKDEVIRKIRSTSVSATASQAKSELDTENGGRGPLVREPGHAFH